MGNNHYQAQELFFNEEEIYITDLVIYNQNSSLFPTKYHFKTPETNNRLFHLLYYTHGLVWVVTDEIIANKILQNNAALFSLSEVTEREKGEIKTYLLSFGGLAVSNIFSEGYFSKIKSPQSISDRNTFESLFQQIELLVHSPPPEITKDLSGILIKIIGFLHAQIIRQQPNFNLKKAVEKAEVLLRSNFLKNNTPKVIADSLNLDYERFRKSFKQITGTSPKQYQTKFKIEKAKELLGSTQKSEKEISVELGFDSYFYFQKLFKEKTGLSLAEYRRKLNN